MVRLSEMIYTEEEMQELREEINRLNYIIRHNESREEGWKAYVKKFNDCMKDYKDLVKEYGKLEEENRKLKKENEKLKGKIFFRNNRISWFEGEEERLNSVINTLKKKLENSVGFWKKKVAKLSEENRQLKHRNEILDLSLKASVHPLVYNELVGNIEISK